LSLDSPNASSTYQYIDSNFQVAYGGGDGATGDWGSDIVSLGGAVLQNAQFGVMYKSTVEEGILGVSYTAIEGRQAFSGEPEYPNFPVLLVQQGYIASRAFSLYTNADNDAAVQGELLFGGIDTDKFTPPLVTIDLIASGFDGLPGVVDFTISLNGASATDHLGSVSTFTSPPMNVILDSGTTFTNLAPALVDQIWASVGATAYTSTPEYAYVQCSGMYLFVSLRFSFVLGYQFESGQQETSSSWAA
jgi:Eukaryotic aspartyl protease